MKKRKGNSSILFTWKLNPSIATEGFYKSRNSTCDYTERRGWKPTLKSTWSYKNLNINSWPPSDSPTEKKTFKTLTQLNKSVWPKGKDFASLTFVVRCLKLQTALVEIQLASIGFIFSFCYSLAWLQFSRENMSGFSILYLKLSGVICFASHFSRISNRVQRKFARPRMAWYSEFGLQSMVTSVIVKFGMDCYSLTRIQL